MRYVSSWDAKKMGNNEWGRVWSSSESRENTRQLNLTISGNFQKPCNSYKNPTNLKFVPFLWNFFLPGSEILIISIDIMLKIPFSLLSQENLMQRKIFKVSKKGIFLLSLNDCFIVLNESYSKEKSFSWYWKCGKTENFYWLMILMGFLGSLNFVLTFISIIFDRLGASSPILLQFFMRFLAKDGAVSV